MLAFRHRAAVAVAATLAVASVANGQTPSFHHRQGGQIESVFFFDSSRGCTVEDGGRIRVTADGGDSWTFAAVPDEIRGELRGIFFRLNETSDLVGWAVGDGGVCLLSTDEGFTWEWINEADPIMDGSYPPKGARLWDIHMITGSVGWAVGDDGAIARTADGGVNWSIPGGYALPNGFEPAEDEYDDPRDGYDIHFFDSENGMLSSDYAAVHITADGGETWTELSPTASITECPVPISPNIELWGMAFDDPNDENTVSVRRVAAAGA